MTTERPDDDPRAAIGRVNLFAGLSSSELDALLRHARRLQFHDGAVLFLEGEPCSGMHLIVQGAVRVFAGSSSGREIQLTIQEAPASIAEVPVFDGGPYPASARAVGEVVTYQVPKESFEALVLQNPGVALKILTVVGERLRTLVKTIQVVTFGGVRQRLGRLLLDEEERLGGSPFELTGPQRDLASTLGTVREVVSRNLHRFQSEGLIRMEGRRVWIEDRDGLLADSESELR